MPNIINIYSKSKDLCSRLISNLAYTQFVLDGEHIASIEGFHQGIKFEAIEQRRRVFGMWGNEARQQRIKVNKPGMTYFYWGAEKHPSRSPQYYALYHRALLAKFTQHQGARDALLATEDALFEHRAPRIRMSFDQFQKSHTCQSLYTIRKELAAQSGSTGAGSNSGTADHHLTQALTELEQDRANLCSQLELLDTAIRILRPLCKTNA